MRISHTPRAWSMCLDDLSGFSQSSHKAQVLWESEELRHHRDFQLDAVNDPETIRLGVYQ